MPAGKIAGPSRYASDFATPVGSLSPPLAPRLATSMGVSSRYSNSQQVTSDENSLKSDGDRRLDGASMYRQDYGVRQTIPPAGSRRRLRWKDYDEDTSPRGHHVMSDASGDMSNYQRDFTAKEVSTRVSHRARACRPIEFHRE